jgi:hypothetical protein
LNVDDRSGAIDDLNHSHSLDDLGDKIVLSYLQLR